MTLTEIQPGERLTWTAVVSNYGHTMLVPVEVIRVNTKRVTVRTHFNDGRAEWTRSVKPENLSR